MHMSSLAKSSEASWCHDRHSHSPFDAGVDVTHDPPLDAHQQQSKRARVDRSNAVFSNDYVGKGSQGASPQHAQPMASDSFSDRAEGQEAAALQPEGQYFHWMPVFCQMGRMNVHPRAGPGSLVGPWGSNLPSMQAPIGPQGGLQPYPFMGLQPNMPTPSPAAPAPSQSQQLPEQRLPAAVDAKPGQHASSLTHVARTDSESGVSVGCQQQSETTSPSSAADTAEKQQRSIKTTLAGGEVDKQPLGMAACMPQLVKQLSNRSSEDLTARAVAKLWGVNLRRYTGRSS